MKALILAGGKGTRLRPITYTRAKQLVPVANKPILHYAIESLVAADITDIGVIVGDTAEEVRSSLGDGSQWGARIEYIPQEAPLGLAHAVKISEEYMAGEPFVMYLGDNLIREGVHSLVAEFRETSHDAHILLAHVPHANQFGVAELSDGRIVRLIEKPKNPPSDLALVGVYLFTPVIFDAVKAIVPSARGELEITDAIQWLVDNGHAVHPHIIDGWWKDTGKLDDMLEANRIMLDLLGEEEDLLGHADERTQIHGRVRIGEGTVLRNSVVRGPVVIGGECVIEDSYIGPYTSVGDECAVISSEVEHSILLKGARIENAGRLVADSLMGCGAVVRRAEALPTALRFMLGDNSEVDIV